MNALRFASCLTFSPKRSCRRGIPAGNGPHGRGAGGAGGAEGAERAEGAEGAEGADGAEGAERAGGAEGAEGAELQRGILRPACCCCCCSTSAFSSLWVRFLLRSCSRSPGIGRTRGNTSAPRPPRAGGCQGRASPGPGGPREPPHRAPPAAKGPEKGEKDQAHLRSCIQRKMSL